MIKITNKELYDYYYHAMELLEQKLKSDKNVYIPTEYFEAEVYFNDKGHSCYVNGDHCYITLLICFINALYNFIISFDEKSLKIENVYSAFEGGGCDHYFLIYDHKNNSIIFSVYIGEEMNKKENEQVEPVVYGQNQNPENIRILIDWVKGKQKKLDSDPNKEGHMFYIQYSLEALVKEVLPCFEENITDIPEDSILWQTPLLKETMANFEELKTYAKEKGWIE